MVERVPVEHVSYEHYIRLQIVLQQLRDHFLSLGTVANNGPQPQHQRFPFARRE